MKGRGETSENITRTLQGGSFENGNRKVNKQHISLRRVNEEKITTYTEVLHHNKDLQLLIQALLEAYNP